MLNITLVCMGKCKESYLREACAEYQKRMNAFCRLQLFELAPQRLPDGASAAQVESALAAEGRMILEKIPPSAYMYAMCIEGRQRSSERLSEQLERLSVTGTSSIAFVIGSSYGLSDAVKARANERFSMSEMTFPHQLARVMLLEQLYRAFQIGTGGKYHK